MKAITFGADASHPCYPPATKPPEEREGRHHYDQAAAKFDDAALILD